MKRVICETMAAFAFALAVACVLAGAINGLSAHP